jgi:hypothetical protein
MYFTSSTPPENIMVCLCFCSSKDNGHRATAAGGTTGVTGGSGTIGCTPDSEHPYKYCHLV